MKLHYKGTYNKNPEELPANPHKPNCVKFKEPEDTKKLGAMANLIASAVVILLVIPLFISNGFEALQWICIASLIGCLCLFPHEIIHAICFKKDVYLYTNLKEGMLFVVGPEDMSKLRFIFMSLLPTIVLGLIPYIIYLFNPEWILLGALGAINASSGGGDFINVYNALTQMPKGSRTYLHHFHSYWYMPEKEDK